LYEAYRVDQTFPLKVTVLGRVRAPHQPAAMLRVFERWPEEPQDKVTVRPVRSKASLALRSL
jgi:hypothetical protein